MELAYFTLNNEKCFISIQKSLIKLHSPAVYSGFVSSLSLSFSVLLTAIRILNSKKTKKKTFQNNNPINNRKLHWVGRIHIDADEASSLLLLLLGRVMTGYKAMLLHLPGATKSVHYVLQERYRGNEKKEIRTYMLSQTTMQNREPAKVIQPDKRGRQTKSSVVTGSCRLFL